MRGRDAREEAGVQPRDDAQPQPNGHEVDGQGRDRPLRPQRPQSASLTSLTSLKSLTSLTGSAAARRDPAAVRLVDGPHSMEYVEHDIFYKVARK